MFKNPLIERFGRKLLRTFPESPGVYFFVDKNHLPLYVGKALNLRKRLTSYWGLHPNAPRAHLLEMLEKVQGIQWKICQTEAQALEYETELIQRLQPEYNISGTWESRDFFVSLTPTPATTVRLSVRDSNDSINEATRTFGSFKCDRHAKAGYPALLRLLSLLALEGRWFHHPAAISRAAIPRDFSLKTPPELLPGLCHFFSGRSAALLPEVSIKLLSNSHLPRFLSSSIEADLADAQIFFLKGPRMVRHAKKKIGLRNSAPLSTELLKKHLGQLGLLSWEKKARAGVYADPPRPSTCPEPASDHPLKQTFLRDRPAT